MPASAALNGWSAFVGFLICTACIGLDVDSGELSAPTTPDIGWKRPAGT
jgi:hypothetical protein